MRILFLGLTCLLLLGGCASKEFDQRSYDRQNKAAEKSIDSL